MPKKLTQEEAEKRSLGVGIEMVGEYTNSSTNCKFRCPCGKLFLAQPSNIWNKHTKSCGCNITCKGKNNFNFKGYEEIRGSQIRMIKQHAKGRIRK